MNPEIIQPEIYPKKWGGELWVINNDKYCGKILNFVKGAKFSMHYHVLKEETWYVLSGKLKLKYFDLSNADEKEILLSEGQVVHLYPCTPHQLVAEEESVVIEFSTPHREDDSYRIGKGDSQ